jgi:cell division protein FtsL
MAQTEAKLNINGNGYYESVAYDMYGMYGSAVPQEIPETAAERDRKVRESAEERRRAAERSEAIKRAREAQAVSAFAVVGYVLAAAVLVFMLLSYVRLTEVSTEITNLKREIETLQTEQTKLAVEYETTFNTNRVADYATGTLGMTKLTDRNTHVLKMEHDNKAEVLNADDSEGIGIIRAAREFVSDLAEYFR